MLTLFFQEPKINRYLIASFRHLLEFVSVILRFLEDLLGQKPSGRVVLFNRHLDNPFAQFDGLVFCL